MGTREGFTMSKGEGNKSFDALALPSKQKSFESRSGSSGHLYGANDSITSGYHSSTITYPCAQFPRSASHVFSRQRIAERKEEAKIIMNPLLMNKKYPVLSDGQVGRWLSESHRAYVVK